MQEKRNKHYSLDCKEGHMKKTKKSLWRRVKVKKTLSKMEFIEIFFFLKMFVCARNKGSWCRKCLGAGVRGHPPSKSCKKYFCLPQSRVKWVELTNVTCFNIMEKIDEKSKSFSLGSLHLLWRKLGKTAWEFSAI